MKDDGLQPNLITYNSVLSAFAGVGKASQAVQWMKKIREAHLRPDLLSYRSAIKACSRSRPQRADLAEELLHDMLRDRIAPDTNVERSLQRALGDRQVKRL